MVVGHARRIRLPVPVVRSVEERRQEQERGRAHHARREPPDLELLLGTERLVLVGTKVSDQRTAGRREERIFPRRGRVSVARKSVQGPFAQADMCCCRPGSEIAGDYGSKPLYRNLGYFSLICLLRVHTLLGDPTRK